MTNLKTKKILITGAHGFLGKHLVDNLINKRKLKKISLFLPTAKKLDLTKWKNCQKAVAGQDIVIHLAAKVGGIGYNLQNPGQLFYQNLIMGINMMEAARLAKVSKFVVLGSVCAYPKFSPIPFKEEDLWNGYPEETNAPYGLAKKMALVQAQAYRQQYNFNAIYLLPVNLYGPGDNFDKKNSHVIPALIRKIAEAKKANKKNIIIWGDGQATREFLYVKDAAEAIILATEKYDKPDPVNIGSGKEISIKDLVLLICQLMDYQGKIIWDKSKPNGQPRRKLDVSRAKKEFGFQASKTLKTGLKETINWYLTK
ncbi:GDP-L-fucose synthase family protein [Patescibacteria group bacterium]